MTPQVDKAKTVVLALIGSEGKTIQLIDNSGELKDNMRLSWRLLGCVKVSMKG